MGLVKRKQRHSLSHREDRVHCSVGIGNAFFAAVITLHNTKIVHTSSRCREHRGTYPPLPSSRRECWSPKYLCSPKTTKKTDNFCIQCPSLRERAPARSDCILPRKGCPPRVSCVLYSNCERRDPQPRGGCCWRRRVLCPSKS